MRQNLDKDILNRIQYLVGSAETVEAMVDAPAKEPFAEDVLDFLNDVSRRIMRSPAARAFSDVITFGFWLRRASTAQLKERFARADGDIHLGRGVAFHIAPSNVPVNFGFSLVAGLLTGNRNVVRVPSKPFPQVDVIVGAINAALEDRPALRPYIVLARYERSKEINDLLSGIADTRIAWGGDATIAELRRSPLPPRSTEITFADRYSLSVIDSHAYLAVGDRKAVAQDFYNDTYFSDQNACTSPRIVVWVGGQKAAAREAFWAELHALVREKYTFQPIQGINKLTSGYLIAVREPGTKLEPRGDNLVVRATVPEITDYLMDLKDNSGYFFEYDCDDILELKPLCDDKRCQTIGLLGDARLLEPLLRSGIRGVDRVAPLGKTMDFDMIWDGYDLVGQLTRTIKL